MAAYPTPAVPKTADGKPDLTGPTPRTADGKPDFSGLWIRGDGQLGPAGGGTLRVPPPTFSAGPPVTTFRDVGANMKEGLPLQPWAADLVKARQGRKSEGQPGRALPADGADAVSQPRPAPEDRADAGADSHHVRGELRPAADLHGRQKAPGPDAQPWWYGYSVGRWDGDTLVVETSGFRDGGWLDIWGNPMTDAAKLTERFRRPNYGTIEIDVTIDDPKAYTKPWTVRVNQRVVLDGELIEFICLENQQFETYLNKQK